MAKAHKTLQKVQNHRKSPFCNLHLALSRVVLIAQKTENSQETAAMSIKIEIYTKLYCAYCDRAKELLRIKGVNFVEYDITDDQHKAAEMQQRARACRSRGFSSTMLRSAVV